MSLPPLAVVFHAVLSAVLAHQKFEREKRGNAETRNAETRYWIVAGSGGSAMREHDWAHNLLEHEAKLD